MFVYQIVEYDWVSNKYSGYMESVFLRHTNLLYENKEDANKKANNMNYVYTFHKFRVEETEINQPNKS